jgi:hypothetical protein
MLNPDRDQTVTYSYILAGLVTLMGVFKLMSYNEAGILDGIFTAAMGILLFVVARTVSQGRVLGLYISGLVALASLAYSLGMARYGSLFFTAVGLLWCFWLSRFQKQGELK